MKPDADSCAGVDELLLDYAYGDLEGAQRRRVEEHLAGCPQCRTALMAFAETRHAMAALTPEPAPEAGLESLLAYAAQSAAQRAALPKRTPLFQWLVPVLSMVGVTAAVMVLATRASRDPAAALQPTTAILAPATPGAAAKIEADPRKDVAASRENKTGDVEAPRDFKLAEQVPAPAPVVPADPMRVDGRMAFERPVTKQAPAKRPVVAKPELKALAKADADDLSGFAQSGAGIGAARHAGGKGEGLGQIAEEGSLRREAQKPAESEVAKDSEKERSQDRAEDRLQLAGEAKKSGGTATGSRNYALGPAQQTAVRGAIAAGDDEAIAGTRVADLPTNVYPVPSAAAPKAAPRPDTVATVTATPAPPAAEPAALDAVQLEAKNGARSEAKAKKVAKTSAADLESDGSPEALLRHAYDRLEAGDLAAAESGFARFLSKYEAHPRAHEASVARASLLERLGRGDEALQARAEIARRWPSGGAAGSPAGAASPARARPAAPMEKRANDKADSAH